MESKFESVQANFRQNNGNVKALDTFYYHESIETRKRNVIFMHGNEKIKIPTPDPKKEENIQKMTDLFSFKFSNFLESMEKKAKRLKN